MNDYIISVIFIYYVQYTNVIWLPRDRAPRQSSLL